MQLSYVTFICNFRLQIGVDRGKQDRGLKLEQVRGEGSPMVCGLLRAVLRVEYTLPIVKYASRIIVAQNAYKRVLEAYPIWLQLEQVKNGQRKTAFRPFLIVVVIFR